jgi:hypothetical protein
MVQKKKEGKQRIIRYHRTPLSLSPNGQYLFRNIFKRVIRWKRVDRKLVPILSKREYSWMAKHDELLSQLWMHLIVEWMNEKKFGKTKPFKYSVYNKIVKPVLRAIDAFSDGVDISVQDDKGRDLDIWNQYFDNVRLNYKGWHYSGIALA